MPKFLSIESAIEFLEKNDPNETEFSFVNLNSQYGTFLYSAKEINPNGLTSDQLVSLAKAIEKNAFIESITISRIYFTGIEKGQSEGFDALLKAIAAHSNLKALNLPSNQFNTLPLEKLCQLSTSISELTALETLTLEQNDLAARKDDGFIYVLMSLRSLHHLRKLGLGLNWGDETPESTRDQFPGALAELVTLNPELERLELIRSRLFRPGNANQEQREQGLLQLFESIQWNANFNVLDLSHNSMDQVSDTVIEKFSDMLAHTKSLTSLNVCQDELGRLRDNQLQSIAYAIGKNQSITVLNLGSNELDQASHTSLEALFIGISKNLHLEVLDFSDNNFTQINEPAFNALLNLIKTHPSLKKIRFSAGEGNQDGLTWNQKKALIEAVKENHALQFVFFQSTTMEIQKTLEKSLVRNLCAEIKHWLNAGTQISTSIVSRSQPRLIAEQLFLLIRSLQDKIESIKSINTHKETLVEKLPDEMSQLAGVLSQCYLRLSEIYLIDPSLDPDAANTSEACVKRACDLLNDPTVNLLHPDVETARLDLFKQELMSERNEGKSMTAAFFAALTVLKTEEDASLTLPQFSQEENRQVFDRFLLEAAGVKTLSKNPLTPEVRAITFSKAEKIRGDAANLTLSTTPKPS